ncbi:MAG: amino acid permease [Bacteroidetes bacterium]|nr:amino acid permease [Bacteroidota bacterium]
MKLFRKKPIILILSEGDDTKEKTGLVKTLRAKDLAAFGIASIIGAGIFGTIGNAAFNGGPAISVLFIVTAIVCAFSALCYAEMASSIPVSGSAYTYSYALFGEIIAWIVGWDLLLEYAIGNIAVAISWSDYFTGFLKGLGIDIPGFLCTDYRTAKKLGGEIWNSAPQIGDLKIILDIPALLIVFLITWLAYKGIKESRNSANAMVIVKLVILVFIILIGVFYINTDNWSPFAPNGVSGMLKGISAVFFAYIGFDAISTTAEECENPQRDMPKGILWSLIICTVLYVIIALVLTGMTSYKNLNVGDPLALVFDKVDLGWIGGIVAFSAIIAMAGVLLVFQIGQPRIWMSMSKDGLLPKKFSKIHPKNHTPGFATIVTGFLVSIPILFMNLTEVTDLCSIGTLFAFTLVCGGILLLPKDGKNMHPNRFKVPYVNGKFILPVIILLVFFCLEYFENSILKWFMHDWHNDKIPTLIFIVVLLAMTVLTFLKNLSLIPVLGLLSCLYLMSELGLQNWIRFFVWMAVGLVIYFVYGYRKSKMKSMS